MPVYEYSALDNKGKSLSGIIDAESAFAARQKLRGSRIFPVSITELSHLLGVSPPSASNMVERLVEKGLLVREPSPDDRRKVVISVAPPVVAEIRHVEESVLGLFVGLVERLGPETARKWCEVLAAIKTVIEADVETEKRLGAV